MSKTVFIGDIHGSDRWKSIVSNEKDAERFVFVGDYFDSLDIAGLIQIHNFKEIMEFKENSPVEVVTLVGNHDYHYYPEIGSNGTSGYQARLAPLISMLIQENRDNLQMAYAFDNVLCTHAGVGEFFLDQVLGYKVWNVDTIAEDLNELFRYKPKIFEFNGFEPTGDNTSQTPLWIRPKSLVKASKNIRKRFYQVVGHTMLRYLDLEDIHKWAGGKYFFIDTLNTSGEYLLLIDGVFSKSKVAM